MQPTRTLHLDAGISMRGGQWQALRLVEGLDRAGHQATLLSPAGSPCYRQAKSLGLDARPLSAGAVFRLSRGVDFVHVHDARSHTLAAMLSRAPLIVARRVAFPLRAGVLSRCKYRRACRYIAVSEFVRGILIAGGVPAAKISVVYDGVPLLPMVTPQIPPRIVAPASDDPQKGTALATEAARIAGLPLQLSTDLEKDLPGAALFVYITGAEGLGSGVLLGMSAGVPVIASRIGGIPEIVTDGETGLLTGNDPHEIAAAMLRMRRDPALSALMALAARRVVEQRFSAASMISSTIGVYQQIHA